MVQLHDKMGMWAKYLFKHTNNILSEFKAKLFRSCIERHFSSSRGNREQIKTGAVVLGALIQRVFLQQLAGTQGGYT